ncbi:hypothetical protein BH10ACT2_BH10ACT2_03140 [soil metagenome]
MIDDRYQNLAEGLFDGGLAADVAPKNLKIALSLLNAAGRPGSEAELASMAARVRQFSAEVNAAAKSSTQRATGRPSSFATAGQKSAAYGDTGLCSEASFSPATLRSSPIFATRVTRKALTVVAITMLAAGTAAAASGGALPIFKDATASVVDHANNVLVGEGSQRSDTGPKTLDRSTREDSPAPLVEPAATAEPTDPHSQCVVWTNSAATGATSASFAELLAAADAAALTIDEYCNFVLVPPAVAEVPAPDSKSPNSSDPGGSSPQDDQAATPPTAGEPADGQPVDDKPKDDKAKDDKAKDDHRDQGNDNHDDHGNHGNGNQGNGHH